MTVCDAICGCFANPYYFDIETAQCRECKDRKLCEMAIVRQEVEDTDFKIRKEAED